MPREKMELRKALKLAVKGLILQEVRVLQFEQARSPSFILGEMAHSVEEAKREIMGMVRFMDAKERDALLRRLIVQSVDEEIEQTVRVRRNRCLRCIHVRYFDEAGSSHVRLPLRTGRARVIGCETKPHASHVECRKFIESPVVSLLEDYLSEMAFLYRVREMFEQFEGIWDDYLTK
jgi:hypothetical protein